MPEIGLAEVFADRGEDQTLLQCALDGAGADIEDHSKNRDILGDRHIGSVRHAEGGVVLESVGHSIRRPITRDTPIATRGTRTPGCAAGAGGLTSLK